MPKWEIKYWESETGNSPIKRWFKALTKDEARAITKELSLLEECGNELKLPHSKSLKKKLFELRERKYGLRVYYAFYRMQIIIVLAAGDKSSQENDIKIARERLSSVIGKAIKSK